VTTIDPDDVTLLYHIVNRDADALSLLYDRYHRLVFSVAIHIVGDEATAEDITLDTFTRVWERADSYDPAQASVSTWLTSIGRNRSIDIVRRRSTRPVTSDFDWSEISTTLAAGGPTPEESTSWSLRRDRIRAAVEELPEKQRQALVLAFFGGYTHREVAEKLDEPLGTVKTRIRLAMLKLKDVLTDDRPSR